MPLIYKAQQSALESKDGKKKWHPRLVKIGDAVTASEMSEEIAKRSSLSSGDVLNVIDHLMDVMRTHLLNSRSVKLDKLGNFTAIIRSGGKGVDTEEEVNTDQISELKIRFTPAYTHNRINGTTRALFANVKFEKYDAWRIDHEPFNTVEEDR